MLQDRHKNRKSDMLKRNETDLLSDISGKLDNIEGSLDMLVDILKDYTGYHRPKPVEAAEAAESAEG